MHADIEQIEFSVEIELIAFEFEKHGVDITLVEGSAGARPGPGDSVERLR